MSTLATEIETAPPPPAATPPPEASISQPPSPEAETSTSSLLSQAPRPAWVEITLNRLQRNFEIIARDKPAALQVAAVVKDDGYGHGALAVAQAALRNGAKWLAVSTVEEGV